jgi:hypothetical protein
MAAKNHALLKYTIILLTAGLAFAGCVDRISTLGLQYYTDTIATETSIRSDAAFMQFADTVRPFVTANGIDFALTDSTTLMMIGKVNNPYGNNDYMESWGLLQFPSLIQDSVNMIVGVRLILKDGNCSYGDTTSGNGSRVSFNVYGLTDGRDFDTVSSLASITPPPIGTIDTIFPDSTDRALEIPISLSVKNNLTSPFFNYIITPMSKMTNVRGFGTIHSYSDINSVPLIEYYLNNGDSVFDEPIQTDLHYVHEMSTPPPGEFTLRGSAGERERIMLTLANPKDTTDAQLSPLTTINNAVLVLHLDPTNSSHSNVSGDTIGPDIVQLGLVDSGGHYDGNGTIDSSSPNNTTYRFQIRDIVQEWLRDSIPNLGFEIRAGYSSRSFYAPAPYSIGVEDNTVNRWTFYGPNCSDMTKRPYFILSYSKLK